MSKYVVVAALGVVGVVALGFAPLETLVPAKAGHIPRAALLIQLLVLVLGAAALGRWAAPKLELEVPLIEALLARRSIRSLMLLQIGPGVLSAVAGAVAIVANGRLQSATLSVSSDRTLQAMMAFQMPLVSKLLYGGMSEEVVMRWGLMSACALLALKLGMRRAVAIWVGIALAAFLFGAGHLPFLSALMPNTSALLVGAVVVGNFGLGVVFGWLFSRYGLEAAMSAHAGAHLLSHVVG